MKAYIYRKPEIDRQTNKKLGEARKNERKKYS